MHVTLAAVMLIVALLFASAVGLYSHCHAHRARRWRAQWEAFLRGQTGLDRELDRIWHLMQR